MTILGRAAFLPLLLVASPVNSQTPPASGFPYGTWGQDAKHCATFAKGQGSNAWQITEKETRHREIEGQLSRQEIVSIKKLENGHFRLEVHPFKNDPEIQWNEIWTDDRGASLLSKNQFADPNHPPEKYVACKEKPPTASGNFGKWQVDPSPESPRAVLDGEGGFPKITVSCTSRDTLGYQFHMADGKAPRFITLPDANGDINLEIDPSGFMPPKNAARFVGAMASLFKQGQIDGSREPESAMKTAIAVNGRLPDIVPIGGLMAVREALRPMCMSAKVFVTPPPPIASAPRPATVPTAVVLPTGGGKVTLRCEVSGRGSSQRWTILVSIDPSQGSYAIMNANRGVTGRFGMIGIDASAYRLQTASPMGLLRINRNTGDLVQYNVSELMGADNRGQCVGNGEYIPF